MLAIIEDIENEDKKSILSNWYKKYNRIMRKKAYDIIRYNRWLSHCKWYGKWGFYKNN